MKKKGRFFNFSKRYALVGLIAAVIVIVLHQLNLRNYPPPSLVTEEIFITDDSPHFSRNKFGGNVGRNGGYVDLEISGFGMIEEGLFFDAYYLFNSDNKVVEAFDGFLLNTIPLTAKPGRFYRPSYNPTHRYIVLEGIGETEKLLEFSIQVEKYVFINFNVFLSTRSILFPGR